MYSACKVTQSRRNNRTNAANDNKLSEKSLIFVSGLRQLLPLSYSL